VKALLDWVSEYAVRVYTTPDSAVTYLIHTQIAYKLRRGLLCDARLQPKIVKTVTVPVQLSVV